MNAAVAGLMMMLISVPIAISATPKQPEAPSPPNAQPSPDLGPEVVMLDQVRGCYGTVRFEHLLHAQMSNISGGCVNCHHDADDKVEGAEVATSSGPVIRPCRTCHEVTSVVVTGDKPGLRGAYHRQCLGCHSDWTHENACGFCHADSSSVKASGNRPVYLSSMLQPRATAQGTYVYQTAFAPMPVVTFHHEEHTGRFGLECSNCHAGASCGKCHGSQIERPLVSRQQTCYQCHEDSRCVTCHNRGEKGPFDHSNRSKWRLRPGHASLACRECHGPAKMPGTVVSQACEKCHAKRYGDDCFNHSRTGVELDGDHAYFACTDCHSGGDDRMLAQCDNCHNEQPVAGLRKVGVTPPSTPPPVPAPVPAPAPVPPSAP